MSPTLQGSKAKKDFASENSDSRDYLDFLIEGFSVSGLYQSRTTDHYHLVLRDYEKLTESHLTGCIEYLSKVFTGLLPHNESISSVQVDLNQFLRMMNCGLK